MREKRITELDIRNMNKTDLWISYEKAQLVVTINPNNLIDFQNRDYITSIKCIGSAGETILPLLVISEVNILYKWNQHNDLNGDIVIDKTKIDYANDETFFK